MKGKHYGQKGCQVPMLSRKNDLGAFKKQKGKYVWSSDSERRAWDEARLEGKQGPDILG